MQRKKEINFSGIYALFKYFAFVAQISHGLKAL